MDEGYQSFTSSFFVRVHGLTLKQVGTLCGPFTAAVGLPVLLAAPALMSRFLNGDMRLCLRVVAALTACSFSGQLLLIAFGRGAPGIIALPLVKAITGPVHPTARAALFGAVPPSSRARISVVANAVGNILGGGFGPLVTGALSDRLEHDFDSGSLRLALAVNIAGGLLASPCFAWASAKLRNNCDSNAETASTS